MNAVVPHSLACRSAPYCQYSLQSARKYDSCFSCHCCAVALEHGDCLQTHRITNIRISLWMPFASGQSILVPSVFCYTTRFFNFVRYECFGIRPFLYSCIFIFMYIISQQACARRNFSGVLFVRDSSTLRLVLIQQLWN